MTFNPIKFLSISVKLLKDTAKAWFERDPFQIGTSISYYTIFSLPGLLVIIINIGGYFLGSERMSEEIHGYISQQIGQNSASAIKTIMNNAQKNSNFTMASILSLATLIFGATGVFVQLQKSLNQVWDVQPRPRRKWLKFIKDRAFSFGLILMVGFLLLVSLILSTALSFISSWISAKVATSLSMLFYLIDALLSLATITLLFAAIFKVLPDVDLEWKHVWVGAVVTACLFVVAKFGLSYYFGKTHPGSTYGAAGSIILVMLWVNYASMLLLFGAEFTRKYADLHGQRIKVSDYAILDVDKVSEAKISAIKSNKSKP